MLLPLVMSLLDSFVVPLLSHDALVLVIVLIIQVPDDLVIGPEADWQGAGGIIFSQQGTLETPGSSAVTSALTHQKEAAQLVAIRPGTIPLARDARRLHDRATSRLRDRKAQFHLPN